MILLAIPAIQLLTPVLIVGLALNPLTYQPRSTYKYPNVIMQQFS